MEIWDNHFFKLESEKCKCSKSLYSVDYLLIVYFIERFIPITGSTVYKDTTAFALDKSNDPPLIKIKQVLTDLCSF